MNEFYTLLIDLSQSIEKIKEGIYHRTLTEISSFLKNQNFEHKILFNLTGKELSAFIQLFNQFAKEKKIRSAESYRLKTYNKYGILAVSFIRQKDKFLCVNFYRVTSERAVNISSFTPKNAEFNATHIGRAHRALHWLDILEFRNSGVKYYDFCGWYSGQTDKALLNVNKFKEQFTNFKIKEYTGVVYLNPTLRFLKKMIGS
ncbi:hypothetical protein [Aurantibacillus circumpalustris]|uniref:hypothetical protein n=1 Tax=Aurantibacillus circumpalustris TaxID=3036359 RepID=UPI00295B861F|nr:hypothetical protein [Aurantibacillus circumpalustris]